MIFWLTGKKPEVIFIEVSIIDEASPLIVKPEEVSSF
jgi:hypothetical protein